MSGKGGYLSKKGEGRFKSWKKRWFIVENDRVSFYHAPGKPKDGEILFSTFTGPLVLNTGKKKKYITITTNEREYSLLAENEREAKLWVEAINKAYNLLSQSGFGPGGEAFREEVKDDYKINCTSFDDSLFSVKSAQNNKISRYVSVLSVSDKYFGNVDTAIQLLQPVLTEKCKYYISSLLTEKSNGFVNIYFRHISNENIFHLIQTSGKLETYLATLYSAEILLAIESVHSEDFCFTVLPLHYCQLDGEGHVRVISIDVVNTKTGARALENNNRILAEYSSPEILQRIGFSKESNWWNFGILIYEMLQGLPPFYGETLEEIMENVQNQQLEFPKDNNQFTPHAKDLITKLLDRNPKTRLGANGPQEVRDHPFFSVIEWSKLEKKETRSIYIPQPGEKAFDLELSRRITKVVYDDELPQKN
ncbi:AGC family protein kinase [Histomonas meleagridis]|uniref:AGC family protein kinase n=1 Tax=Histomonas meleagridis TaxID=135588 RepID=UPI003559BFE9|nr:AGC family protein kinase [Histomonas meleagridis]KAH0805204.1 AGC family protein kinase [Histomonas meleagridis]